MKIFFDMDGVLVDFAGGAAEAIMAKYEEADLTHKKTRRLIQYDGPDKELPITGDFIETSTAVKDSGGKQTQWQKRVSDMMFSIVGSGGHEYWANLPSLPGFADMITFAQELVGVENVYVCTAPVQDKTGGCESGKRAWIASNTTIPPEQVFVTEDKPSVMSNFPDETCVLIDDRQKYVDAWTAAGGTCVHHRSPANMQRVADTKNQLELIVNLNKDQ